MLVRSASMLALLASSTVFAGTVNFSVTNANDSGPGSLRQALLDLQSNPDAVLFVTFQPSYPQDATIQLLTPLPVITQRGVIISGSQRNPRIRAPVDSTASIIRADAPLQGLTLTNLRFEGGRSNEGGGCVHGMHDNLLEPPAGLAVSGSSFTDCQAIADGKQPLGGGAILWRSPEGSVTIYSSAFNGNAVLNGPSGTANGSGGAISMGGRRLTVETSRFLNNRVEMVSSAGGAIDSGLRSESVVLWDNVLANNRALAESGNAVGGAVSIDCFEDCGVTLDRNYFADNRASAGGALFVRRGTSGMNIDVDIANTTFRANHASGRGGAVSVARADLALRFNTLEANSADDGGAQLMLSSSRLLQVDHNAFGEAVGQHCLFFTPDTSQRQSMHNAIVDAGCRQQLQPGGSALTVTGTYEVDLSEPMPVIAYAADGPLTDAGGNCVGRDARFSPRPQDGNGDGVARCDIGAYERPTPPSALIFGDGFEP